jgi:hypothetical protein
MRKTGQRTGQGRLELELASCGDTVLAAIQTPEAIRAILDHLGLPSRAPPLAPARPLPRSEPETTPEPPEA